MARVIVYILMMLFAFFELKSCNGDAKKPQQDAAVQVKQEETVDGEQKVTVDEEKEIVDEADQKAADEEKQVDSVNDEQSAVQDNQTLQQQNTSEELKIDLDEQREVLLTEEENTQEGLGTREDEASYNRKGIYDDVLDYNQDLQLLPRSEFGKEIAKVYDEMRAKEIDEISYQDDETVELFLQLYKYINCEWFFREGIEGIKNDRVIPVYDGIEFYQSEDGSLEVKDEGYDMFAPFSFEFPDAIGGDEWYNVKGFRIDKEDNKKIYISYWNAYSVPPEYKEFVLDFNDLENVILVWAGKEYVYIDTSLTDYIKRNIFLGKYVDQDGVDWEFKDNYQIAYKDQEFHYDPFVTWLNAGPDTIDITDAAYKNRQMIDFEWKQDKLYLYHIDYDEDGCTGRREKPFVVLTKVE